MTNSIVTGAAGFIGSHLVEELLKIGHTVTAVDNEYADNDKFHWNDKAYNVRADITDYKSMKNVCKTYEKYMRNNWRQNI